MKTSIMLFTRDLRIHDNPALAAACAEAERVVPVFVYDDVLLGNAAPNQVRFLADSLDDLRETLCGLGGDLVVRRGDPVAEVVRLAEETGAGSVHLAADVSPYATARLRRLSEAARLQVHAHPGLTVVPPGDLWPQGGDHYRVFTPYWRAWSGHPWRPVEAAPKHVRLPDRIDPGKPPLLAELKNGPLSPDPAAVGGELAGRRRMTDWLGEGSAGYDDTRDDLAADGTSRLSSYLRFGCVSPLELARAAEGHEGFRRQLCWRDFHHQVAAAFPDLARRDYRPGRTRWRADDEALAAWRDGLTGIPVVDAGMRQLRREGFMHNRARMITASFLTRNLGLDWRHGLHHFHRLLIDGDLADNAGNWQWVAGTGNDTRPNRVLSPLRQAARFDPDGDYVRRYLPELAALDAAYIHHPWTVPAALRRTIDYPAPIIDL